MRRSTPSRPNPAVCPASSSEGSIFRSTPSSSSHIVGAMASPVTNTSPQMEKTLSGPCKPSNGVRSRIQRLMSPAFLPIRRIQPMAVAKGGIAMGMNIRP